MIQLLLIVFGFKVINHHTERKFANLPNAFMTPNKVHDYLSVFYRLALS